MFINFSHPPYLVFLFVVPVLIFLHFYGLKNLKGNSLKFANFEAIARVKGVDIYSKNLITLFINIVFVLFLVFALSGLTLYKDMDASSFSFVVIIDASESMSTNDVSPDRISVAKKSAGAFVDALPKESYVGVVSFSGDSYVEKELSKDKRDVKYAIDKIELGETSGTDIYEAVSNSIKLLKKEENKAIILFSDGQINVGDFNLIIENANENNVVVHTFGIGTLEGGEVEYGISKLDEDGLKSLAYNTNGRYFKVDNDEKINGLFDEIIETTRKLGSIDLSFYLIIAVIFLFVIKQYFVNTNRLI